MDTIQTAASPYKNFGTIEALAKNRANVRKKPFSGCAFLTLIHGRPSSTAFHRALLDLGAEPQNILAFVKDYDYPEREATITDLFRDGVVVTDADLIAEAAPRFLAGLGSRRFFVIEDGGRIMPLVFDDPRFGGGVEQTTKGRRRCGTCIDQFQKPVLDLTASKFKSDWEPPRVAKAALDAIVNGLAGVSELSELDVAVVGAAGTIGAAVADLISLRAKSVTVFDARDSINFRLNADRKFKVACSLQDAIKTCRLLVSCTGENVLRSCDIDALPDGVILVSTGSETTEFPVELFEALADSIEPFVVNADEPARGSVYRFRHTGKSIVVLHDGKPINFARFAPAEPACFDLVMAAILAGVIELALGVHDGNKGFVNCFDTIVQRHYLADIYLMVHAAQGVNS